MRKLLTILLILGSGSGFAQLYFAPRVDYSLPGASTFVNLSYGDFNKDGVPDMVVGNSSLGTVSVFIGTGTGTFNAPVNLPAGSWPAGPNTFDANNDGNPDIGVADFSNNTFSILLGNGAGSFAPRLIFPTGSGPQGPIPGDFNEDGKIDVAIANYTGNTVAIHLGNGDGTFASAVNYPTGSNPGNVVMDLNNDNHLDLLVNHVGGGGIGVRFGTGTGTFGTVQNYTTGSNPRGIAIGDYNGDTLLDLAIGNASSNTISILTNTGSSSFNTAVNFASAGATTMFTSDYNNDGKLDLAVSNTGNNTVSIYIGSGTGSFSLYQFTTVGSNPSFMRLLFLDLNNDSLLDIVTSNDGSNVMGILLGNTPTGGPGTSLKFNGTNQTAQLGTWFNYQNFAITMWVKPGAIQTAFANIVDNNHTTARSWVFEQNGSNTNEYFFDHGGPSSNLVTLVANVWQHVALVSVGGNFFIYLNGQLVASQNDGPILYDGTQSLTLGGWAAGGRNWNGDLDEVRFFDTALTPAQIESSLCGEIPVTTANLAAYYHMNEGSGNNIFDGTSNAHIGTLVNGPVFGTSGIACPVPTITGFSPTSGSVGSVVTITGTNFSTTPGNNIVYFGATQAAVTAANGSQLTVSVPVGATYEPISVSVSGLTAHAPRPFVVTFSGGGNIDNCSFAPSTTITTTPPFVGPGFADIDGDGKPDMLIPNYTTSNFLSVFRNTSTVGAITPGSFAPKIDFAAGTNPVSVAVGDLDGDGKRDIAVINYRGGKISVYKNQSTPGTISLAAKVDFTVPDFADDVSIADMDGDGKQDLTITTSLVGFTVLRNTGAPGIINASTFAAGINFATGPNAFPFVLGDIDGDGKLDAAVPNANAYFATLLRNTSTPGIISFATQSLTITTGTPGVGGGTLYTVLGDIDGDNKLDLVVTTNTVNTVSIFRNTSVIGALSFDPKFDIVFASTGNTPALNDLDGDGKIELIVDRTSAEILVYKNVSSAGIVNATSFATPVVIPRSASTVLLAGDVDGDGRSEIISSSGALQVFRNVIGTILAPTITSFAPPNGLAGTTVTITGTNFSTQFSSSVDFNGSPAAISGSTATTLTVTVPAGATTGPINVAIGCNTVLSSGNFDVCAAPAPPSVLSANNCGSGTVTLGASGGTNGNYVWYSVPTGGTAISGAVNDTFITPTISVTTDFYVALRSGSCESARTPVTATITPLPSSPTVTPGVGCGPSATVLLNASGGSTGEYRWYAAATGGSPIAGETSSSYSTPILSTSTTYFVSINNGTCESPRISILAEIKSCAPTIAQATLTSPSGGQTSLDISSLVTTISDPLDIASIRITQQPISGAVAIISSGVLVVDYSGVEFAGIDQLTIEACDIAAHCAQRDVTINVVGDITVFNAVSPNGDGKNDTFIIQYINTVPQTLQNTLTIFNRWGTVVFEAADYDNSTNVFKGLSKSGEELPSGTYFYKLAFNDQTRTGFISLRR